MQIDLNVESATKWLDGRKTYVSLGVAAAIIALNHFGLIPAQYVPQGLDPGHWLNDEFTLLLGATFRSALKKGENPPDQQKSGGA